MAHLSINGLHMYYGDAHAVRGVDLEVPDDQFTVFVGPSGCGKSTMLRAIAGLEDIGAGTIAIDGEVMNDIRPRDRNVAMVFQNYALYPYMNVFDNIGFGLRARKFDKQEIGRRVHEAAQMLGLEDYLDRMPRQLSGGQRQRVAIGRAIVRNARLFLFDEPLSNLDAQLRDDMRAEIKRLHQEIRQTMVYVTHDQIEAMTLGDRIVLLRDGLVEQEGTPFELYDQPATKFVASFIGSPRMNFIPVELVGDPGAPAVRFDADTQLALPSPGGGRYDAHIGRELLLGVRPEHMRHTREDGTRPGVEVLTVLVDLVQPTGSRVYASFALAGTEVMAELEARDVPSVGDRLEMLVDMNRAILIDPDTERTL
ncbi:MAG: sn-glycerol-3-phosphate ABC transporter ATP-binding protein UgpC [Halofilum sp. (in: g-proteobacteria)]|nr:sn-glycerol-3-phosphate ABC transporter ATP-binding protein UgpC [Halofilum sp. (in: g-proteobacteria)]